MEHSSTSQTGEKEERHGSWDILPLGAALPQADDLGIRNSDSLYPFFVLLRFNRKVDTDSNYYSAILYS
jgi:hypothetical protein